MSEQYKEPYTKFIVADVSNGIMSKEQVQQIQKHFASQPNKDPKYLASLNEALEQLLGPEEVMKRMRDRE